MSHVVEPSRGPSQPTLPRLLWPYVRGPANMPERMRNPNCVARVQVQALDEPKQKAWQSEVSWGRMRGPGWCGDDACTCIAEPHVTQPALVQLYTAASTCDPVAEVICDPGCTTHTHTLARMRTVNTPCALPELDPASALSLRLGLGRGRVCGRGRGRRRGPSW